MSELNTAAELSRKRAGLLTSLYKDTFPDVARFVNKRGGSLEQAKDVFHDALVIWYEKTEAGQVKNVVAGNAYLFGIVKHLWYRKFAEGNSSVGFSEFDIDFFEEEPEVLSQSKLFNLLETSGKKCMEMLKSFYYDKLSIKELAAGFGFKTERSATVQKYKCLEKVRETVKEKSLCYEDFLD